jgi:hypothetical protein
MKPSNRRTKRLTNAGKRRIVTLASAMSIKIPYNGQYILCDSADEAIKMLEYLKSDKKIMRRVPAFAGITDLLTMTVTSPWTRESFWQFMESLGESQKHVLAVLVAQKKATDEELRKALKLENNQALAGVLSGISKQAGALNVPARAVYSIQDERKGGELSKTYAIASEFLAIANEMNWTGD